MQSCLPNELFGNRHLNARPVRTGRDEDAEIGRIRNMRNISWSAGLLVITVGLLQALPAAAQSFRVQCSGSTITHPSADNNSEPAYTGPTVQALNAAGYLAPTGNVNGAIRCQQIGGGDGYSTMGDGTQTYMFSFGPLSGVVDIGNGLPGTEYPNVLHAAYTRPALQPGDSATTRRGTFTSDRSICHVPALDHGRD